MRTASDVLTNPKPGDVVMIGPGWTRRVTQRNGDMVEFYSTFGKRSTATTTGPYGQSVQRWKNELTNVEVINVAPE
jgi:hypothetical protein